MEKTLARAFISGQCTIPWSAPRDREDRLHRAIAQIRARQRYRRRELSFASSRRESGAQRRATANPDWECVCAESAWLRVKLPKRKCSGDSGIRRRPAALPPSDFAGSIRSLYLIHQRCTGCSYQRSRLTSSIILTHMSSRKRGLFCRYSPMSEII